MSLFHYIYYLRSVMHFLSHCLYSNMGEEKLDLLQVSSFGLLSERIFCSPREATIPGENSHCFFQQLIWKIL